MGRGAIIRRMHILVVEDEESLAGFIRTGLEEQGFRVTLCHDGNAGYALATEQAFDAIVLDLNLPGRDGLSILSALRQRGLEVAVIVLTARAALDERLEGLNLGADDYLTKPFYVEELVARLQAVARRQGGNQRVLQLGNLTANLLTQEVRVEGQVVELTRREFRLLEYLLRVPGHIYTRTQILEHVWGYNFDPETNLVDVHIKRLRAKLCKDDRERLIETVRGVGYRIRSEE